jgi:hypothetical protein
VQASRAITGKQPQFEQVEDDEEEAGLKDGFEWYMKPQDKSKYEAIYQENRDMRGEVSCELGTGSLRRRQPMDVLANCLNKSLR